MKCRHPFHKQVIRLSAIPGQPYSIPPVLFNKPLSGLSVKVTQVLAEKLDFEPKYFFDDGGSFSPSNKTFGPGIYRNVTIFSSLYLFRFV